MPGFNTGTATFVLPAAPTPTPGAVATTPTARPTETATPTSTLRPTAEGAPATAGELNYAITTMVLEFLGDKPKYHDFFGAIRALECAKLKLELYRRVVGPYEDQAIARNGDVYPT